MIKDGKGEGGGGHGGLVWETASANSLRIEHNFPVVAGGIKSANGRELQAGSGTVLGR